MGNHGLLHGFGPRARLLVGQQGKRRGFAGTVAFLAMALEDGRDVLGEGDGGVVRCGGSEDGGE